MRITLTLSFAGGPAALEPLTATFPCPDDIDPCLLQTDLSIQLQKELGWADFRSKLPDVSHLQGSSKIRFTLDAIVSGEYHDRMNTREAWFEIVQTIYRVEDLLAGSRAYKQLEYPTDAPAEDAFVWRVHLVKMKSFNLAVFLLAKIEDLIFRLLFEGLSASFTFVNQSRQDWEYTLQSDKVRDEFKNRSANPVLKELPDPEFEKIKDIVDRLRAQPIPKFLQYRKCLTHRLTPSVDYVHFSAAPQSRLGKPVFDKTTGERKGYRMSLFATPRNPDYQFLDLYSLAVETLNHYAGLLRELKAIPRFAGE